jgi:hypothetical protein
MVTNEEIKNRLEEKKSGIEREGYLVCDTCKVSYELQVGEKPEDYSSECECGGNVTHIKNITEFKETEKDYPKSTGKEVIKGVVYFIIIVFAGFYFLWNVGDMFVSSILWPILFFGGVIAAFLLAKYLLNRLLYGKLSN